MASMSYCMFENTAIELDQVVLAMKQAGEWSDLSMNQYEIHARKRLKKLCERYLEYYEMLEDNVDEDNVDEDNSEPVGE